MVKLAKEDILINQLAPSKMRNKKRWLKPFPPDLIVLVKNVFYSLSIALKEAQDIDIHLQPLHAQLSHLEKQAFPLFETFLPALIHTVFLLWTNCKSYQRPARIVVLLQEICNLLIEQVWFLVWIHQLTHTCRTDVKHHSPWSLVCYMLMIWLLSVSNLTVMTSFQFLGVYIPLCRSSVQGGPRGKSPNG